MVHVFDEGDIGSPFKFELGFSLLNFLQPVFWGLDGEVRSIVS